MTREYQSAETGTKSNYHIIIDGIGLTVLQITGRFGPFEDGVESPRRETPVLHDNFSNGMGMAYRSIEDSYAFGRNVYTRTPRLVMPGGLLEEIDLSGLEWDENELGGEIRCFMEHGIDVLVGAGQHIVRLPLGLPDPVDEYYMGAETQIDSCVLYNTIPVFSTDYLFDNWQYLTAYNSGTSAWVTANDAGGSKTGATTYHNYTNPVYLQKMITIFQELDGSGGTRIFGNDSAVTYAYTQSTVLGDIIGDSTIYSSSILCGDTSYRITGIYGTNRVPIITKADGVYGIEQSGIYHPNYTPNWKGDLSALNGISGMVYEGQFLVGMARGLQMVDIANKTRNDVPKMVNPSYYLANETPIFGLPTAMCTDNGWAAVSFYNGKDSHIMYGIPKDATLSNSPSPIIWHGSECSIPDEKVTQMFVSSVSGRPRMYIGTHDGTRMHLYMLSLPKQGNPVQDYLQTLILPDEDPHQYALESELFLPIEDWKDAGAVKVLRRFEIQADNLDLPVWSEDHTEIVGNTPAAEIQVYANADSGPRIFFEDVDIGTTGSEWIYQGSFAASPSARIIPSGSAVSGKQIAVGLIATLTNQGTDEEPVYTPWLLRALKTRAGVIVEQMEEREYTVLIGEQAQDVQGGHMFGDPDLTFNRLYNLQNEGPVQMIDEYGERVVVKVEPGITFKTEIERVGQHNTLVAHITISFLGRPFYYDVGSAYDSVYAWSA